MNIVYTYVDLSLNFGEYKINSYVLLTMCSNFRVHLSVI
jgi:hypothetical protein